MGRPSTDTEEIINCSPNKSESKYNSPKSKQYLQNIPNVRGFPCSVFFSLLFFSVCFLFFSFFVFFCPASLVSGCFCHRRAELHTRFVLICTNLSSLSFTQRFHTQSYNLSNVLGYILRGFL